MALSNKKRILVWVLLGLCVLAIPVGLMSGHKSTGSSSDSDGDNEFTLGVSDHIQVIRLNGMIADEDEEGLLPSLSSDDAPGALKKLRKAVKNTHVKGVLLRVNSPGGTIGESQEVTNEVKAFKDTGRPIVVSMGDLAASGGYYISSAADRIYAQPGTLTGSIGVIMSMMNFKVLADKVGVAPEVIKSGKFKDIGNPLRPMTAEERSFLTGLIMDAYDQFVTAVAEGRKMKVEDVKKIADGRVYNGRQAKKIGLVDELGGYDEALNGLQDLCMKKFDLKEKLPVKDKTTTGIMSLLMESASELPALRGLSPRNSSVVDELLPRSMTSRYFHVPLWMME